MTPRLRSAVVRFDALPEPVLRVIMLALPVDERARAACVCRGWRAFLADVSLWQVLDLTGAGGVGAERVTENLVRGAVARAAGELREISFHRVPDLDVRTLLVAVVVSDGAELQQLNTDVKLHVRHLQAIFAAAPRLQVLSADVRDTCAALLPFLRNDAPYGAMRISGLQVWCDHAAAADVLSLAAALVSHESLNRVILRHFAHGLNALVDAVAERRVSWLQLLDCAFDAQSLLALARLLQRGSLTKLDVVAVGLPDACVHVLCAALRTCHTLTQLALRVGVFPSLRLVDAAAALPALSKLDLCSSRMHDRAAFGRALGALIGANPPSLRTILLLGCRLGDEGMAPVLDGLAANTHLRELDCTHNNLSEAFKRDRLAPALAALAARAHLAA